MPAKVRRLIEGLLILMLTNPALARVGDTPEELRGRFGEPLKELHKGGQLKQMILKDGDFRVIAFFSNGRVTSEIYCGVTPERLPALLKRFSDNWSELTLGKGQKMWMSDAGFSALYSPSTIKPTTPEQEEQFEALEGFRNQPILIVTRGDRKDSEDPDKKPTESR
jgi:hypothetical protein